VIKYLGSKRRLVPVLAQMVQGVGGRRALDLFTGTTRVAQAMKALGVEVTAVDTARYSEIFARCYIETDAHAIDERELHLAVAHLDAVEPSAGYVTETFCRRSRFFQPFNGERIDAIRDAIERDFARSALYPILLTSLVEAADRVDSTTGVQMAYVKQWAPRSFNRRFERVFGTQPQVSVSEVARGFGLPVADVSTLAALDEALGRFAGRQQRCVIRVELPSRTDNVALHERIHAAVIDATRATLAG
jgi:adenine-specific DNA methylase